ncbi:sensor histidine kinase [Chthonobacter rhizosphaerae]|uniref:sensor histidine kinase n=1 Tax=Chthonobacter rhizosphaerae TaxID=2735553 RepID=UPI001AED1941|nr:histidine kinase dimerization/phosphoacceptor domain -containing protein [Chthonobacter rhizosphaerae]
MLHTGHPGEAQFRELADFAPVMIWRSDLDKLCDFFNAPWLEFTGRPLEAELGFGWADGVHPDDYDRCVAIYSTAFDERSSFSMDYRLRRHDGEYRWVRDNARPFLTNGQFAGYLGSCIDVTDMIDAVEERGRLVAEKAALTRELHHRVRNNLQLITSLLVLQADTVDGPTTRDALREAAQRVQTMALAQTTLHETDSFSSVDLSDYLRLLVEAAGSLQPGAARFEFTGVPVRMTLERSLSIGLAINEALMNAARHAFPDGRKGHVSVTLSSGPDDAIHIDVMDDGVGLPRPDLLHRPRTLGLRLMTRLIAQSGGAAQVLPSERGASLRFRLAP